MKYKVQTDKAKAITTKHMTVQPMTWFCVDFLESYRSWSRFSRTPYKLEERNEIYGVINKIFENAVEMMKERPGGAVLNGIGYLAFFHTKHGGHKYYKTKYNNYLPYLFTDVFPESPLKGWSVEYSFLNSIRLFFKKKQTPKKLYYNEIKAVYQKCI